MISIINFNVVLHISEILNIMRTIRIYQKQVLKSGQLIELDERASHHLKHVLRFKNRCAIFSV